MRHKRKGSAGSAPSSMLINRRKDNRSHRHVQIDFAEVTRAALPLLLPILRRLLPDGKVRGHEYVARNPRRADRAAGSFSVNIRTGRWADFASDDKGGDVISLVAFIEGLSQIDAARAVAVMIGLGGARD
jgi:hypothetical protein